MRTLILCLRWACAVFLLACGSDNGSPAATATTAPTLPPEPTATAAPTQTPEPSPEATLEPTRPPPPATAPRTSAPPAPSGPVTVVAQALQFTNSAVRARAGSVTIVLDNRDPLVPHNVSIAGLGATPDCNGPCTSSVAFTAGPGSYRFLCTIHPDMTGSLTLIP